MIRFIKKAPIKLLHNNLGRRHWFVNKLITDINYEKITLYNNVYMLSIFTDNFTCSSKYYKRISLKFYLYYIYIWIFGIR